MDHFSLISFPAFGDLIFLAFFLTFISCWLLCYFFIAQLNQWISSFIIHHINRNAYFRKNSKFLSLTTKVDLRNNLGTWIFKRFSRCSWLLGSYSISSELLINHNCIGSFYLLSVTMIPVVSKISGYDGQLLAHTFTW